MYSTIRTKQALSLAVHAFLAPPRLVRGRQTGVAVYALGAPLRRPQATSTAAQRRAG